MLRWTVCTILAMTIISSAFMIGYRAPNLAQSNPVFRASSSFLADALNAIDQAHQINQSRFDLFKDEKHASQEKVNPLTESRFQIHKSL